MFIVLTILMKLIHLNVSLFLDLDEKSCVMFKFASVCVCMLMLPTCILNMYNKFFSSFDFHGGLCKVCLRSELASGHKVHHKKP